MKTIHNHNTKTLLGAFALASLIAVASSERVHASGVILIDDFSTDTTVTPVGRVFESTLDVGWRGTTGYGSGAHSSPEHDSQWDISSGTLNNDATQTDSYVRGETPAYNWFTNPIVGDTRTKMTISFDYSTSGSDTLTAHFWAAQNGGDGAPGWITNNQGWINGSSNQNEGQSANYNNYNLANGVQVPSGPTPSISGALSGTGTFTLTIDVSTLGIAGVSDVGDIDTFFIAFAGNETTGGTTTVDNLLITVPEPSSTALLGLGALAFALRRRR